MATDAHLVALVREGRGAAFEAVYDRHHRGILSFCRHMLGDPQEAEDAVQHTFLAAYNDLISSKKQIHLRAWLFAIARNRCYSVLRSRREQPAADLGEAATEGLAAQVQRREDLRDLVLDMRSLPEDQRAALVLAELESLSHEQIGEALGVPREKVKALVFQARESLVASRTARETDCAEIREQLATQRGGALRRANLRRHVRECAGCREFRRQIERQRRQFAILLPVVPGVALKEGVLGATVGSSATIGLAGGGLVFSSALKSGLVKVVIGAVGAGVGTAGTIVATRTIQLPFGGPEAPATHGLVQQTTLAGSPALPASPGSVASIDALSPSTSPQARAEAPAGARGTRAVSTGTGRPTGGVSFSSAAAISRFRYVIQSMGNAAVLGSHVATGGATLSLPGGPYTPPARTGTTTGQPAGHGSSSATSGADTSPGAASPPAARGHGHGSSSASSSGSTGSRSDQHSSTSHYTGQDGGYGAGSGSPGDGGGTPGGSTRGQGSQNGPAQTGSGSGDSSSSGSGSGEVSSGGGGSSAGSGSGGGASGVGSGGAGTPPAPSGGGDPSTSGAGSGQGNGSGGAGLVSHGTADAPTTTDGSAGSFGAGTGTDTSSTGTGTDTSSTGTGTGAGNTGTDTSTPSAPDTPTSGQAPSAAAGTGSGSSAQAASSAGS